MIYTIYGFFALLCVAPSVSQAEALTLPPLEWSGDLRFRLAQSRESQADARRYQQLRVRLGVKAEVNESVQAVLRLATGTSAISTNQTMGDSADPGMARRDVGLDLGYINWQVTKPFKTWLGRTANPFWSPGKVQLMFDADLAFEGFAAKWDQGWSHTGAFANGAAYMVSENFSSPNDIVDTGLVAGQVGYKSSHSWGEWTLSGGFFSWVNIQNKLITGVARSATIDSLSSPYYSYRGNTAWVNDPSLSVENRRYFFKYKYEVAELSLQHKMQLGSTELVIFADFIRNTAVGGKNNGYEAGLSAKHQKWTAGLAMIEKQADSTVAAFTDSDTNGGGTDNRGQRYQLGYQLGKNAQLNLTQFVATRGLDSVPRSYALTLVDAVVNF